jgi:ABC-2 type transport system permease protein
MSRSGPLRAVFRRELGAYFVSPMSYLVAAAFLVASGWLFATSLRDGGSGSMAATFPQIAFLLLFATPLLTMRLVADELRSGTLEVLLTEPVSEAAIVLGKFGAALLFVGVLVAPTLGYPVVLAVVADPDPGPIVTGYLGLGLLAAVFVAVGLCASATTANPVASAAVAFSVLFVSWLLGRAADALSPGVLRDVLSYLATFRRFADFCRGIVDTRSVVCYLSLVGLALFVATRALAARRLR